MLPFDASKDAIPTTAKLANGKEGKPLKANDGDFETAMLPLNGTDGAFLLDRIDLFNLLCVPGETDADTLSSLEKFCRDRRAFLIADSAQNATFDDLVNGPDTGITGADSINAALYFPWIIAPDPLQENRPGEFPSCGFVAGLYARTDATRGVWKAPAGTDASLTGVNGVKINLTDNENGMLNPKAINCIRTFPVYGTIVWGARTLQGNDERGSEWKYIPVRRTALFIEESLFRALKWVVFEPNDEPLWAQIRLNVGAFMHNLFRQGAFQGTTPKDAYFVKCDKETTTQNDINLGIVNIVVGFAPLKPAEFVIVKLQQMAGQIEV
jgi:phage tail sheath protein FI